MGRMEPAPGSRRVRRGAVLACASLAATVAFSAGLNLMLYRYARRYFRESQQVRLDPEGLWEYPDDANSPSRSARPRVLLFGDSRAQMWILDGLPPELEYLNRGIGSQTTRQILSRIEPHLLALHPDIVLLQAGINDLKNIALFPDRGEDIVADCFENIAAIVERATQRSHVVLTTIFPHGPIELQRRPFWNSSIDRAIVEVNRALASLCGPRCTLVDSWPLLARGGSVAPPYALDALHINNNGYRALNSHVAPLLRGLAIPHPSPGSKRLEHMQGAMVSEASR